VAEALRQSYLPCPPDDLAPPARNAWFRLYALHAERGTWRDIYRLDLDALAHACGWYVEAARACRAPLPGRAVHPDAMLALETGRRLARALLVDWGYLSPESSAGGDANTVGFDAALDALCAPLR
jgi:hypothetical protein